MPTHVTPHPLTAPTRFWSECCCLVYHHEAFDRHVLLKLFSWWSLKLTDALLWLVPLIHTYTLSNLQRISPWLSEIAQLRQACSLFWITWRTKSSNQPFLPQLKVGLTLFTFLTSPFLRYVSVGIVREHTPFPPPSRRFPCTIYRHKTQTLGSVLLYVLNMQPTSHGLSSPHCPRSSYIPSTWYNFILTVASLL